MTGVRLVLWPRALATCSALGLACHHAPPARPELVSPPQWSSVACDTARPPAPSFRRGSDALSASERNAILTEARARRAAWRTRGITDYRVRVAVGCFEGMFAFIEQAARSADVLAVRYDRCLDYPTEIRGDQKVGRVDDWFWTTATGLRPRRK